MKWSLNKWQFDLKEIDACLGGDEEEENGMEGMPPLSLQHLRFDDVRRIFRKQTLSLNHSSRITKLRLWFVIVFGSIFVWMCFAYFVAVDHRSLFPDLSNNISTNAAYVQTHSRSQSSPSLESEPILLPPQRKYKSNGFVKVSCNGGLNQMRAAICDMVAVSRLLNLTLVVPELDKSSFWKDPSNFEDIFNVTHFINTLRDEVKIVGRLPKKFSEKYGYKALEIPPVSWSNDTYYLQQILPLFNKSQVLHFYKTDARLANNKIPLDLQQLRCRVNFQALKFTQEIENLGHKLVRILQERGPFVALHLRYEMDMLAFSGCTKGCTESESVELRRLRYAFPWWREKEIISDERRSQGLCPLTPEETTLILHALGFDKKTQIYIAAGEIYGGEMRMKALKSAFPHILRKETLLDSLELQNFWNHSTRMAALDFIVSIASDVFISTYDGNMAKLVEGHRRYFGYKKTISLDRRNLVRFLDKLQNRTMTWSEFTNAVRSTHKQRMGQPNDRLVLNDKPKEEDYFYANPHECLCQGPNCKSASGSQL